MPLASWDDVVDDGESTPSIASPADIISVEPPTPAVNVAHIDDVASIEPPAAVAKPAFALKPNPALPTGTIAVPTTPEAAMSGGMDGRALSVARTPDEALGTLKPPPKPRLTLGSPRPPEDPITPVVREMRSGVGDAMVGAIDFANRTIGGLKFAEGSRRQGRLENGQLVFDQAPPDEVQQQVTTGLAGVKEAAQRALSATSITDAQTAMWQTLGRAAALPADLVGIPVTQLHDALTQKNYGRAAGLITGLLGVLGGMEGAHGLTGEHPAAPLEERVAADDPAPAATRSAAPNVARVDDIVAVESPPPVAPVDASPLSPTRQQLVTQTIEEGRRAGVPDNPVAQQLERERTAAGVASIDDIVHIEPPQESADATHVAEPPSGRLDEPRGPADEQLPPQASEPSAVEQQPPPAAGEAALEPGRAATPEEAVARGPIPDTAVDTAADSRATPSNPHDVPGYTERLRALIARREAAIREGRLEEEMAAGDRAPARADEPVLERAAPRPPSAPRDESLPPPVVYHGSTREIDQFVPTPSKRRVGGDVVDVTSPVHFFATDRASAERFARDRVLIDERLRGKPGGRPVVGGYRLAVEQPFDFTITAAVRKQMHRDGFSPFYNEDAPSPYALTHLEEIVGHQVDDWNDVQAALDDPAVVQELRDGGFDSARLRENDGSETWAVFDASAISRATGRGKKPAVSDALAMPNPGRRADASGALVPSPASRAVAAVSSERQLRPSEIVRQISRDLDALPVRIGKFSQKAYGIYKPKAQTIRLAVANDLATLAHELGHHIHESLLGAEIPPVPLRDELLKLGAPTSLASYSRKMKLQEGQAEFTRRWIMDPADVRQAAPKYTAAFEAALAKHPELEGVLQRAQRQYIGHLSLDPVERGLAHLDFEGGDSSPKTDVVTRLQTQWVDDLYPLKRLEQDLAGGQPVNLTESGYALARLARGASAKADGFLRHGVRALDGTFIAPALEPALKPVRKQMREFAGYLAAQRAVELRGRGMETGMSLEEARAIVAKFQSPTFDTARDAVYAYQDGLLRYAAVGNLLSKDQYVAIKQLNKAYVPFQRVMDDVGAAAAGGGTSGIANKGAATKRIKGSGRDIVNPLESIVRNTHTLVAQVEQNRAMGALVAQAEKGTGGGRYLERIPDKQIATSFNLEQLAGAIRKELVDAGVDIPDNLDFDKLVTVFTPTQLRLGEKGIVSVMKEGERQWYAVNDPALYDAIAGIGAKSSDLVTNLFMKPARYLRAGATTTLGFVARNPIRDTFEAYVNSRYGFKLGYDTLRGLFEFAKRGDDYQAFLNSGAGNAAMVSMDRDRLRQELARLGAADKRRILDSTVLNPLNLLQAISEATEHATRLGEFMRGVEQEGRTAEGYARAALAARDVTIDFARGGTLSKEINRYTAFFNAGVQGAARLAEVFSKDPRGATFRALTAISIPSLALFAINHEDPDYRELPDWERNAYWHLPTGREHGHNWIRVPKPFTLGQVFGNSFEVALGYLADQHKEDLQRILPDRTTARRQVISLFPTALMPAVEAYTNYDTFRDRAIVSPDDLQLDPALQYNRWTSDLAKYVGPRIGVAPAKLDHLIYGYGAGVASGAVQLVDRTAQTLGLAKAKPAGGLARLPLVGSFSRETPGADAQSLEDFYRLRDQIEGAKGSITRYEKTEGTAAARARVEQLKQELGANAESTVERMKVAAANLKDLRDGVNAVFVSPSLDPDEKKELLDRLYEQMVTVARAGLRRPVLPSRFAKPPAPALLQKLRAGVGMLDSEPDDRARATAPANGARPQGAAAPAAR